MQGTKGKGRQLVMKLDRLDVLPEFHMPANYAVCHITPENIPEWEAIVESAFGWHANYADKMNRPGLCPERVMMVSIDGKYAATAASYDHPSYPHLAFLHMVGTRADMRGKGAGRLAVLSVLKGAGAFGLTGAVLTTDDFRLPAIRLYLSLGFKPVMDDDEMRQRWEEIFHRIANPHETDGKGGNAE